VDADQRGHAKTQRGPDTEADQFASRREPRDPFNQELQVAVDAPEIDILGITSWHRPVVIKLLTIR